MMDDQAASMTRQADLAWVDQRRLWQLGMLVAFVVPLWIMLALFRDVWIDELWTMYMSAHELPFTGMFQQRWTHDTHPPLFVMSQWLFGTAVGEEVVARRLLNLVPFVLFSWMAIVVARRNRAMMPFLLVFGALTFSNPVIGVNFPELRAYFGQFCATALIAIFLYELTLRTDDLQPGRDTGLAIMIVGTMLLALNLHYIAAFICGVVVGVFALDQWRVGHRRWAVLLIVTTGICVALLALALVASRPYMAQATADFWVRSSTLGGAIIIAKQVFKGCSYNIVAVGCALVGLVAAWRDRRAVLTRPDLRYALLLAVALVITVVALLAVNLVKPIIVDRYVLPFVPFTAAALSALAAGPAMRRGVFPLLLAMGAIYIAPKLVNEFNRREWNTGADFVAAQVRACPGTVVYGIDRRDLAPAFAGTPLPNQHEIVSWGMHYVARRHGFPLTMFRPGEGQIRLSPAPCSTVVWVAHEVEAVDAPAMVRRLALGSASAGAHAVSLPNTMLLVIPPAVAAGGH